MKNNDARLRYTPQSYYFSIDYKLKTCNWILHWNYNPTTGSQMLLVMILLPYIVSRSNNKESQRHSRNDLVRDKIASSLMRE